MTNACGIPHFDSPCHLESFTMSVYSWIWPALNARMTSGIDESAVDALAPGEVPSKLAEGESTVRNRADERASGVDRKCRDVGQELPPGIGFLEQVLLDVRRIEGRHRGVVGAHVVADRPKGPVAAEIADHRHNRIVLFVLPQQAEALLAREVAAPHTLTIGLDHQLAITRKSTAKPTANARGRKRIVQVRTAAEKRRIDVVQALQVVRRQ